mmetsp:Transcript_61116/g.170964  ORF Transcript_61116/g.170964 Transcript_61116/m.170964 type:complete len:259 (+) Transcript_61116:66-842(+)
MSGTETQPQSRDEVFRTLVAQNAQLLTRLEALETAAVRNAGYGPAQPTATAQAATSSQVPAPALNMQMLGKPKTFDGSQTKWPDWSLVMRSYASASVPGLAKLMEDAEGGVRPIAQVDLTPEEGQAASQLYNMLVLTCEAGALTKVLNAGNGEGLEAWRALCIFFDSASMLTTAGMLQQILSFDFSGILSDKLDAFDKARDTSPWLQRSPRALRGCAGGSCGAFGRGARRPHGTPRRPRDDGGASADAPHRHRAMSPN